MSWPKTPTTSATPADAVVLDDVVMDVGPSASRTRLIDGMSLAVSRGQFLSITGPAGCGKSTLLSLICGLDRPSSGRVQTLGHELSELSEPKRSDLRLRSIGIVFQESNSPSNGNLLAGFTVEENVAWPLEARRFPAREVAARTREALARVGLPGTARHHRPSNLTPEEGRRVALARAIVGSPSLLVVDEPTEQLDTKGSISLLDLIRDLGRERGIAVILTSNSKFVATYGDRTIVMGNGRIVRDLAARPAPRLLMV